MRITLDYDVLCVIMGGGQGTRLFPITKERAKPAVPLATKYRLIDIPLSNCLNSGLSRIYILTQFNHASLHQHIQRSYRFDRFSRGFVEILAAQQTRDSASTSWYEGTADAVRKNLSRLLEGGARDVLILSGDQIYQMDFCEVLETHRGANGCPSSPVTIVALLVDRERARQLGILEINDDAVVQRFVEKPGADDALLDSLVAPSTVVEKFGFSADSGPWFLANMGIYAFELEALASALNTAGTDFGKTILPELVNRHTVRAHLFHGYWEDIGTIQTFHQANLDLASGKPQFDFYAPDQPVFTRARLLPASKIRQLTAKDSLVAEACRIESATFERALLGIRSVVGHDVTIRNSFVMGNDVFETSADREANARQGRPNIGIGDGSVIENAIVDKNCRIGRGVQVRNEMGLVEYDDDFVSIRDGVAIVPRNGVLPEGYRI